MGTVIGQEISGLIVAYGDKITAILPVTKLSMRILQKKFYTIGTTDKNFRRYPKK
jgi:hypothetical protein